MADKGPWKNSTTVKLHQFGALADMVYALD